MKENAKGKERGRRGTVGKKKDRIHIESRSILLGIKRRIREEGVTKRIAGGWQKHFNLGARVGEKEISRGLIIGRKKWKGRSGPGPVN